MSTPPTNNQTTFFAFEPGQFNQQMRVLENASALSFIMPDQMAIGSKENGVYSIRTTVEKMTEQSARIGRTELTEALLRENGL